ncbi:MAG TPA: glycosyltransferase family 2 protein, partial [Stellaceae bacterium]|nr:glycosyltransferase family 2 protein [Stellaceae bacterium]
MSEKQPTPRNSPALLSVVVPCFNEQEVLPQTHRRLIDVLGREASLELEMVYVDDGSSDATPGILNSFADADDRVVVVSLARNFGHQAAVTAGLQYASGDAVAVIDADLQDPPEVVVEMIAKWRDGYDVVYGVRARREGGIVKRAAYRLFYRFMRAMVSIDVPLDSGDFSLMDRRAVDALNSLPERNRFIRGLRAWIGLRQIGIPYRRPA